MDTDNTNTAGADALEWAVPVPARPAGPYCPACSAPSGSDHWAGCTFPERLEAHGRKLRRRAGMVPARPEPGTVVRRSAVLRKRTESGRLLAAVCPVCAVFTPREAAANCSCTDLEAYPAELLCWCASAEQDPADPVTCSRCGLLILGALRFVGELGPEADR